MSYQVVYYTRSGFTKRIAEKLAKSLGCDPVQITDGRDWKGFLGFLKAGYYASRGKDVEIAVHGPIDPADELIVVSPLWAGTLTPAVRVFLKGRDARTIRFVVTSNGSRLENRAGFRSVTDIVRRLRDEDGVLDAFLKGL